MPRFKILLFIFALLAPLMFLNRALAETQSEFDSLQNAKLHTREEFVHGMANMTLAVLQDQKKSLEDRRVVLRQCFGWSLDIDWIAKFTLGRMWNVATPDQRERYTKEYRTFLTESYVSNYAESQEKRVKDIKILGIQNGEDNDFFVNTDTLLADREDVKVDYRVSEHEGKYKVIDIIIEKVSLLATHRSQFSEIAANQGVEAAIAKLHALNSGKSDINVSMR